MSEQQGVWHRSCPIPLGSYVDIELGIKTNTHALGKDGMWHNARPLPYYSFRTRLKMAWDILRYKADPLYWSIDFEEQD